MSPRSPRPALILLALWLMMFSSSSQVIILAPILPQVGAALGIPSHLQGTLITAYALMLSVFALVMGPVSDRLGRRRLLIAGSWTLAAVLWLHGVASSYAALLTVRALAGAAAGMLSGSAVSYVGDYFPYERRGWANGWVMSGIAFGQIAGIPLGTVLAGAFGFRAPFLLFAATMMVAAVLIGRFVPQPDVVRSVAPLTVRQAVRDYAALLRAPALASATAAYFLMFFSVGLYTIYLPTWLGQALGMHGAQVAALFFFGGIANVVTGPAAGRLSDRIGRKPLIVTSCLGLGALMAATTYVVGSQTAAYLLFAATMVMVAMRISPLQSLLSALVPADRRGTTMSLAVSMGQVGIGLGSAVAGLAYTHYGYRSNTLIGALSMVLMALIVSRCVPEPHADAVDAAAWTARAA